MGVSFRVKSPTLAGRMRGNECLIAGGEGKGVLPNHRPKPVLCTPAGPDAFAVVSHVPTTAAPVPMDLFQQLRKLRCFEELSLEVEESAEDSDDESDAPDADCVKRVESMRKVCACARASRCVRVRARVRVVPVVVPQRLGAGAAPDAVKSLGQRLHCSGCWRLHANAHAVVCATSPDGARAVFKDGICFFFCTKDVPHEPLQ